MFFLHFQLFKKVNQKELKCQKMSDHMMPDDCERMYDLMRKDDQAAFETELW